MESLESGTLEKTLQKAISEGSADKVSQTRNALNIPQTNSREFLHYEENNVSAASRVLYEPPDYGTWGDGTGAETKWTYKEFFRTPYEVEILAKGYGSKEKAAKELSEITAETLATEPFQYFYRHMDMFARWAKPTQAAEFVSLIWQRAEDDGEEFAKRFNYNHVKEDIRSYAKACIERCELDSETRLSQEFIEKLYSEVDTDPQCLRFALVFDRRNKMHGQSVDIAGRVKERLLPVLLGEEEVSPPAKGLLEWTYVDTRLIVELLTTSLLQAKTTEQITGIVDQLAPVMGIEKIRKQLREYVDANPDFRPTFDEVFSYLGFDQGDEVAIDLGRDVYAKVNMDMAKEYNPYNETLPFELDLLSKEFEGLSDVLDVGCGTGRVMIPLQERTEATISGFDLYETDVLNIQATHPDMDVRVGSWFDNPFEGKLMQHIV